MIYKFAIVAICDPYNARFHYKHQKVLERDGKTPVKWLKDYYPETYDTKEEAIKALGDFVDVLLTERDNVHYVYDEILQEMTEGQAEELGCSQEDIDTSWYKGEGWYSCSTNERIFAEGNDKVDDDVMRYQVEELENKNLSVRNIKGLPTMLEIEDTYGNHHDLNYDGCDGKFTREEWKEDPIIELFDEEGQKEILDALENTCNEDFFSKD